MKIQILFASVFISIVASHAQSKLLSDVNLESEIIPVKFNAIIESLDKNEFKIWQNN